MTRMYKFVLFAFLILYSGTLIAQFNYKDGIIITNQDDTLRGKIRDGGGIRNAKVCVFKPENKGKKVRFYPSDIKSYRFNGDKYYSSKEFLVKGEYKNVFSEILLEGEISLYYNQRNKHMKYYIQKKDELEVGLLIKEAKLPDMDAVHTYAMRKGNYYTVNSYIDSLAALFKDSPKVMNVVETTNYTQKSLINLTKLYLKDKCKGSDCLHYEKDLSKTSLGYGVFSGVQTSQFLISNTYFKSKYSTVVPIGFFMNEPVKIFV